AAELTEREREVLGLAAAGLANREIAARLGIGVRTVKGHLTSAFRTVGVADRRAAAAWATSGVLGAGRGRASGRP
ncbi:MAG: helix-turn-helix transcriptional regulator, partial [Thermoleophilia bacterium]|nr:helix-turn-helix transcriptional regulator [Thermoleophilia bacterium]